MRKTKRPNYMPAIGDRVDYHSVIGGDVTLENCEVTCEPYEMCGSWVTFIRGKSGCVAVEALTPAA